ncbi:MAG: PQQ-binding-like beta-propeller repeat protein [Deltaproteobacteria bacterium]|nr:PQQ-binding-like beta-propeller repeat protein [Deltaproteobacteria bacterium]
MAVYRESGRGQLLVTAFASQVLALDRMTGEVRWNVNLRTLSAPVEIVVSDDTVIAAAGSVIAFIEYQSGAVINRIERAPQTAGWRHVMIVDGQHLYVGGGGVVSCYTLQGAQVWERAFGAADSIALGFPHKVRQADHSGR